jgi:uncharacterized protein (TIGR03067 family)
MDRKSSLLLVVFLSSALGNEDDPSKTDLQKLQGKWKVERYVVEGAQQKVHDTWEIMGTKFIDNEYNLAIRLDATHRPKHLNLERQSKGKTVETFQGIYEIDGDTLKICMARFSDIARPIRFESKENSRHVLSVLKRVKDEK